MKTKLPLALGGIAILLVGLALGWWIAMQRPPAPLPPPPWTGPGQPPRADDGKADKKKDERRPQLTPEQVAKFRAEFEQQIAPEVEAFQKGYTALSQEYDAKFEALLTPEQKQLREKMRGNGGNGPGSGGVDWIAEFRGIAESRLGPQAQVQAPAQPPNGAAPAPFGIGGGPGDRDRGDRSRRRQQERLFRALLHIVMYEPFLKMTTETFHLTPEQATATAQLMAARRDAFLKLADAHPLPFDRLFASLRGLGFLPPSPALGSAAAGSEAPAAR